MASHHYTNLSPQEHPEPTLDEMLNEPIVQLVMRRDGQNAADLRGAIERILNLYGAPVTA